MEYAMYCLKYLRHLYDLKGQSHTGVIVVGHSMGGVVARAATARAAMDPDLGAGWVVLTLQGVPEMHYSAYTQPR